VARGLVDAAVPADAVLPTAIERATAYASKGFGAPAARDARTLAPVAN